MEDTKFKVPTILTTNDNCIPNDKPPSSFSDSDQQMCNEKGIESLKSISAEMLLVLYTNSNNKSDILALLNSSISNYYFVDLSLFTSYI